MGKKILSSVQKIIKQRLGIKEKELLEEGQLQISFTFDGKLYVQQHFFNSGELRAMKQMIKDAGEDSAQSVLWRAAIQNCGILAENTLAHAARDYCKANYTPPQETPLPNIDPSLLERKAYVFGKDVPNTTLKDCTFQSEGTKAVNKPSPELEGKIPEEVLARLETANLNLEKSLLEKDSKIPNHLAEIHRLLITYPETNLLLDDDEIHRLIQAQQDHTNIVIVAEAAKGRGKGGGSSKKIQVSDL